MARVALVTGAGRGIGAAIARRLAQAGCRVVGTATTAAGAAAIDAASAGSGLAVRGIEMRVEDAGSVAAGLRDIGAREGAVEILVNNAGITRDALLARMSEAQWREVLDTNVGALYRLCNGVLRGMMRARWGRIVNLSSVVARMGNAGQVNYAASKAAIEGFTRALAREVASRAITVNAVAPGFIDTDMTRELGEPARSALLSTIPLGRAGSADDVAGVVAFLAGDDAAYITGQVLHVNGGMLMA
jgi:3-oxoacyl-[acyl-carrier protein] reductase